MGSIIDHIKQEYNENPDWGVYDGVLSRREIKEILDLFAAIQSSTKSPEINENVGDSTQQIVDSVKGTRA